jgi:hypothetical protein
VLDVKAVLERRPDYLVILPWNIADEVVSQQQEFAARGGRFVVPVPEPRVLEPRSHS